MAKQLNEKIAKAAKRTPQASAGHAHRPVVRRHARHLPPR